jgi:hypothetical protein
MTPVREYDARIDTKKRLTLRRARYDHYHVEELEDGRIILEPRELVAPFEISRRTLAGMDKAVGNLKQGKVSAAVDLTAFVDE